MIPFVNRTKEGYSYWPDKDKEVEAWLMVKDILNLPNPKVFQNGLYDIQYLWKVAGIPVKNFSCDTMILHHSMQPEMQKSLEFLGSVYTNFPSWKHLRPRGQQITKQGE